MKNLLFSTCFIFFLLIQNVIYAVADTSAVYTKSCGELLNTKKPFILVLRQGDSVVDSILNCVDAANIPSAAISGFGMLQNPEIAFFNKTTGQYQYKVFPGDYELIAMNGDVTTVNGKRFTHLHVALGGANYKLIGGHLKDARAGVIDEITIIPLNAPILRKLNPKAGPFLIKPQPLDKSYLRR